MPNPKRKKIPRNLQALDAKIHLYSKHMPETNDLTLIILKGHLLIEEALVDLADWVFPRAQYLDDANLSFQKLACVVRAAILEEPDDSYWQLIFAFNTLRNDLAHNLESSKRRAHFDELFKIIDQTFKGTVFEKDAKAYTSEAECLKSAIQRTTMFLLAISYDYESKNAG